MSRGGGTVRRVVRAVKPLLATILVCEGPADGAVVTGGTLIEGWALSPAGIREVSVWLDGQRLGKAEHGLERPDVARDHPEWPGAARSGFRYRLDAPPAPPLPRTAELAVVVEDGEERRTEVRKPVQVIEPPPPPMGGSLDIPKRREPGDPLKVMGWSSQLVVHG